MTKNIGSVSVTFIVLDTTSLVGKYSDRSDPKQRAWLASQLSSCKSTWIVVAGHHPIYAIGEHGPTPELQNLKPLLKAAGVAFYAAAHDHSLQHINGDGTGVEYVVSGAGKGCHNAFKQTQGRVPGFMQKFFWSSAW